MENRKSISEQITRFQEIDQSAASVEEKLDELIALFEKSNLDSNTVKRLQNKFNQAINESKSPADSFKIFQDLDNKNNSRLEMVDDLESLLSNYQVDSKVSKKYLFAENLLRLVLMLTSIALMVFGFALIVMPATPEFEMFTIFYFTTDDGFTLMDLIALLIVFAGVYLFIRSVLKFNSPD